MSSTEQHEKQADRLAPPMFALSLFFLVLLAALVVMFIDIPRVAELTALNNNTPENTSTGSQTDQSSPQSDTTGKIGGIITIALLCIWPLFWLEFIITLKHRQATEQFFPGGFFRALTCVIPPLRLGTPSPAKQGQIWLPVLKWQMPGKTLSRLLERQFSKPMLIIALLILPILLVEFGLNSLVEEKIWLRMVLHISTGFIWCAFALEFIIMINATDQKLTYIKKNWIDLAIILLPLISFLRTFRILRLAKLARVQQLAKMGRVYRLKGLSTKVLRALMLFGVVNRLLRVTPQQRLAKLNKKRESKIEELDELSVQIAQLEKALENKK